MEIEQEVEGFIIKSVYEQKGHVMHGGLKTDQNLPPKGRRAWVRYKGGECMAYVDASGTWRNYDNGDVLPEKVLSWQLTDESI